MATPPSKFRSAPCRGGLASALALLVLSLSGGCQRVPSTSATASASPPVSVASASPTPGPATGTLSYAEITEQYRSPVDEARNGWPVLKPLLEKGDGDEVMRLKGLDLSKPADLAYFDKDVLPTLQSAFGQAYFVAPHELLSGRDPLNRSYLTIRTLCSLVAQRADLLWKAGKKEEAVKLVALPLSLARALQSRLETVSVNDFSSSYANASLAIIADWASTNQLTAPEIAQLQKILAERRPSYAHLAETITVDFAQLDNSVSDEATRSEVYGLGMTKPEEVVLWKEQLRNLLGQAQKLYSLDAGDPKTFNDAVLKMASQLHGLVLDYPLLAASQKHAYASYLATELALTLEGHRFAKSRDSLTAEQLFEGTFPGDKATRDVAEALLEFKAGPVPDSFLIAGRGKVFQLVSPDGSVVFYQR